jgi:hypothetical protein
MVSCDILEIYDHTFYYVGESTVDAEKLWASATSLKEGKGRWKGQGRTRRQRVWLNTYNSAIENILPLLISTQSVAFSCTDFCTTLYFVNQRNYKTLAMLAHALTRTRYFYSLNVIISQLIVHKESLGYLSVCAIASRSSPPSHVGICNGHQGSELCCVHCTVRDRAL